MTFKQFSDIINQRLQKLAQMGKLFRSSITGNELWDIYISSFRPEDNPVFRDPESSEHNCNLDKAFIRRYGNIVALDENNIIIPLWSTTDGIAESKFANSCFEMSKSLTKAPIADVFLESLQELNNLPYEKITKAQTTYRLGFPETHKMYTAEEAAKYGVVKAGEVYKFNHFYADLPSRFVISGSVPTALAELRDKKNVFERAMKEIPLETLELVKDLINQGSLLDGTTHLHKIEAIIPLKKAYNKLKEKEKSNWCWLKSDIPFAKFRNELIGTLCVELAEGVDINTACQTWNKRVDPANYMKATAPITKKQIEEARKVVEEEGYSESLNRRFATIDDINVDEILHSNVGNGKIKNASIFDTVTPSSSTRHKRSQFDGVEEVGIEKFMQDILPGCTSVEAFLENRMEGNLVTLTTSNDLEAKKMFKWDNNFSWTFNGNLAGKSQIKEEVKSRGGKVDGILRFSIMWADGDGDNSDLDAHCNESAGEHISFSHKKSSYTGGSLDIDITSPNGKKAVENITYPSLSRMRDGSYKFSVNQFSARNSKGFMAEIEFNGEIYSYSYDRALTSGQNIHVATVTLKKGEFSIEHKLPESSSSKNVWNLETGEFHKVNLACLSPNHWGSNNVGNKYYFFMLDKCAADVSIRGFHNENLCADLAKHRKVLEVLASKSMISPAKKQLAGLGFNSTVKDSVILKLSGSHKRTIKVNF